MNPAHAHPIFMPGLADYGDEDEDDYGDEFGDDMYDEEIMNDDDLMPEALLQRGQNLRNSLNNQRGRDIINNVPRQADGPDRRGGPPELWDIGM